MPLEEYDRFLLANAVAVAIVGPRRGAERWVGSPFEWLLQLPPASRGKAGEVLAEEWLRRLGYPVSRAKSRHYDRLVGSSRVEIKFSTLWTDDDVYKFQQIRNQEYDVVLCLAVSPHDAHAWLVPKHVMVEEAKPQHGGSAGRDTRWLVFKAAAPPQRLEAYGGELEAAVAKLAMYVT